MGAVGGLFGTAGGAAGTGFAGPSGVNLEVPTNTGQVNAANAGVNNSLGSSQALLAALAAQNGAGNQSNILQQGQTLSGQLGANNGAGLQSGAATQQQTLNTGLAGLNGVGAQGTAMNQQGALAGQLGGAGGVGAQSAALAGLQGVAGQQQSLANQYQNIANGTGPNPAMAALNQATGQNVANQAALMAGQRGAGANVGLMARQAAQQGANTQQQAVGQAATLQAQQQLNALQGIGAQQQAIGSTNQAMAGVGAGLVGQQQAGLSNLYNQGAGAVNQLQAGVGQQFNQGAQNVTQQQAQQQLNAGIAQNQISNQAGMSNQILQGNIANAGQQMQALGNYNTSNVNLQGNINSANAGLAQTTMKGQQDVVGGLMNAGGPAAKMALGAAEGGYVPHMADGGVPMPYMAPVGQGPAMQPQPVAAPLPGPVTAQPNPGPASSFGQFLAGNTGSGQYLRDISAAPQEQTADTSHYDAPKNTEGSDLKKGASSLGSGILAGLMAAQGGMAPDYRSGGNVKAQSSSQKAVKSGNSYDNDKIPAMLSEGEIVIPRNVVQSADPVRSAADFVSKVLAKRGKK